MTTTSAADLFATNNDYHTPENLPISRVYRTPGIRSLWFHLAFIGGLLRRSHNLARQNRFDEKAHEEAGLFYLKHIEKAGGKFHVTGLDHLNAIPGPLVLVANHMSLCETFVLAAMLGPRKGKNSFVIKENLSRYPMFGPIVKSTKPIMVTRKKPREDFKRVMEQGVELIKEGRCITVFPQTKRKLAFRSGDFNTIGEKLAVKAQVPVMPVALRTDFLAPGKFIIDGGLIHPDRLLYFEFGPPIPPQVDKKIKHQQIVDFIRSRMEKWGIPCLD